MLCVMTLYCSPARRTGKGRGREGSGLYPELGVLGIHEGKSPALVRDVGRLSALLPSYESVQHELAERGVDLNIKEVHGIGRYAGQAALTHRRRELDQYRAGELPSEDGKGKRFGAMSDGGRTKIRTTKRKQRGRGKTKTQKRRFRTDWREPKQIIVFEMDEQGRQKAGTKPILDGTFRGPDEILEVLAMRLHQVGASEAQVVAFRADGAPWIWERLEWVRQRLGLKPSQVSYGLDWCHAVHHVSLALETLAADSERQRIFKKLRKWLKQGAWRKVLNDLIDRMVERGLDDTANRALDRTAAQRQAPTTIRRIVQVARRAVTLQVTYLRPHRRCLRQARVLRIHRQAHQLPHHLPPRSRLQPFPQLLEHPLALRSLQYWFQGQADVMHRMAPIQTT